MPRFWKISIPSQITPTAKQNIRPSTSLEPGCQWSNSQIRNASAGTTISNPARAHEIDLWIILGRRCLGGCISRSLQEDTLQFPFLDRLGHGLDINAPHYVSWTI